MDHENTATDRSVALPAVDSAANWLSISYSA